ncbi:hypothetical protein DFH27DRAFT_12830 [Peziza echinospora]|nr:hypothetical protein DFH27DRAFT_12830 [Peziza echinospora]
MCIRITERYAVCHCVYYVHGIDQCGAIGVAGHLIQERTVLVGYACQAHTNMAMATSNPGSSSYNSYQPAQYTGARPGVIPEYTGSRTIQPREQYRY